MKGLQVLVSLWIHPGRAAAFEAYERKVLPVIARHGGLVHKTIRISSASSDAAVPFEVHVLEFPSSDAFHAYRSDPELASLAAERAAAIARTEILLGRDTRSDGAD